MAHYRSLEIRSFRRNAPLVRYAAATATIETAPVALHQAAPRPAAPRALAEQFAQEMLLDDSRAPPLLLDQE